VKLRRGNDASRRDAGWRVGGGRDKRQTLTKIVHEDARKFVRSLYKATEEFVSGRERLDIVEEECSVRVTDEGCFLVRRGMLWAPPTPAYPEDPIRFQGSL